MSSENDWRNDFTEALQHFSKTNPEEIFFDYLTSKQLSTKQDFLSAFTEAFKNGYIGFHFFPIIKIYEEKWIHSFLHSLFKIPESIPFFFLKACSCPKKMMVLYIDPRQVDRTMSNDTYAYGGNGDYYIYFCFDIKQKDQ